MTNLIEAEAVGWDFDDTLAPQHIGSDPEAPFIAALCQVLRQNGVSPEQFSDAEMDVSVRKLERNRRATYLAVAERFGWSIADLQQWMAHAQSTDIIAPCPELPDLFAACPRRHLINTHAHPAWIERGLDTIGLSLFFDPVHRVFHRDHGFADKELSPATFEAMLALSGTEARYLPFVEDKHANLRIPKELGMPTIWIPKGGVIPAERPSYVDLVLPRAADVFSQLVFPEGSAAAKRQLALR